MRAIGPLAGLSGALLVLVAWCLPRAGEEKFVGAAPPPPPPKASPLTPEEELATFSLPPGFRIELVASEPEVPKPITVVWDAAGRMWTMTAVEYPVDANDDPQKAQALFAQGGRDRVLVFDNPYGPGPHKPRIFADGLAIPLGLLPYRDGAFVQYGSEILFLRDTDGDGRADQREVVLSGFGIQDSHLYPHQFTRGPGNWIYFAQGAFNRSVVKTRDGQQVRFDYCKMGRFQPDGTRFEIVACGLNNIWGFVITREGEMFIQEANDLGYSVIPLTVGANFPGHGMEKLKPYAPWQPAIGDHFRLGGTGLSGLAYAEDEDGWPEPYRHVMYVANPILQRIQAIKLIRDGAHYRLEKLPDFLLSSDEWFRPVAIHFGPDGCLYVVDWYNKIIQHNEVPRNHPERDKTRGRIWRIRHERQAPRQVVNLKRLPEDELLRRLDSPNSWEARTAWQEIVDRQAVNLVPQLRQWVSDGQRPADRRIRALWALEGMRRADLETVKILLRDANRNVRREAVRVLGTQDLPAEQVIQLLEPLTEDPDPQVRAEVIRTLGAVNPPSAEVIRLLVYMGKERLDGPTMKLQQGGVVAKLGLAHDRDFERYLVRAALEQHPELLDRWLGSPAAQKLPLENRLLAVLALPAQKSAQHLATLLPQLRRLPDEEELLRLTEAADLAEVRTALQQLLQRREIVELLLSARQRVNPSGIMPLLEQTALRFWSGNAADRQLALRLSVAFRLNVLEKSLVEQLQSPQTSVQEKLEVLRALREIQPSRADIFAQLILQLPPGVLRNEAILTLVHAKDPQAPQLFFSLVNLLNQKERQAGLNGLCTTRGGARAIVRAFQDGTLPEDLLDASLLERLQILLGPDPQLLAFLQKNSELLRPVLWLDGRDDSYVDEPITLRGPFTVETWIRLDEPITNADSILGRPGVADFNFHDARFRVWCGPKVGDVIIAKRAMAPGAWTHLALTRDAQGRFAIYINGELDTDQGRPFAEDFVDLRIGHSNPSQGTAAAFAEYRIWNYARSPEEIRQWFDRSFADSPKPTGLVRYYHDEHWGQLHGGARVTRTTDYPPILTAQEARQLEEKFARYRQLAQQPGDVARGKTVFDKHCLVCHAVGNRGGQIGPTLSGAGSMTTEALLRSLLTPHAAVESGYRLFRVETRQGVLLEGFLVKQTDDEVILRKPNEEDKRIPVQEIYRAGFTRKSVMPEGLLEALTPAEVADLFAYLRTLK
ncbi:MAG: LamG-like jellyroll fold domain-containing protein [Gemmatales bacterium]|nr:HEAT repeat domain-containing protein [Gemmatales bacterium]MDW7993245.1 LamG-like jellyroll fold domain-containing protein [Gemmatales bacterium]